MLKTKISTLLCVIYLLKTVFFYEHFNIDTCIFQLLEESISKYKNMGSVYVAGDLNARTGVRNDYIIDDFLKYVVSDGNLPFLYEDTEVICEWKNQDKHINYYGRKLLELCKSSGLRIVNGRHPWDVPGDYTFFCSRGNSVIDYLLTESFFSIGHFSTGIFNIFSDHSPISFTINGICLETHLHRTSVSSGRTNSKSVKWIDDNAEFILTEITRNQNFLLGELDIDFKNSSDLNTCINNICSILNECVLPYMDVKVSKAEHAIHKNNACGNMKQDKPWFDETCKKNYWIQRASP